MYHTRGSRESIKRDWKLYENRVSLPPFSKPTGLGLQSPYSVPTFAHGSTSHGTGEYDCSWGQRRPRETQDKSGTVSKSKGHYFSRM